jgi:hypothetical protein
MANFAVRLVDRSNGSPSNLLQAIVRDVQSLFDEAFDGSGRQVSVAWRDASDIDNYVVHFVEDKTPAHSYLLQTWPHLPNIDPRAGGHTYRDGVKSGSEVYRFDSSRRTQARGIGYAKLNLHELFHNQFPHVNSDEVHGNWGGGGLAAAVPVLFDPPHRINDRNRELIRRAFSVRTPQLT